MYEVTLVAAAHFSPRLFQFLRELKAHNDRPWFEANRERYEADVKEPMLQFISDLDRPLRAISPHIKVDPRPVGGSMFRIYRDIRFSKDKSLYKTNIGAHFPHTKAGRDESAPGFYIHLEPANSVGGGGLWHPDSTALRRVRDSIVSHSKGWQAVRKAGVAVEGDLLKRVPPGYDPKHPFAEDLKLKDFYVMVRFPEKEVVAPDFMHRFVEACRSAAPLIRFVTQTLGLPW